MDRRQFDIVQVGGTAAEVADVDGCATVCVRSSFSIGAGVSPKSAYP